MRSRWVAGIFLLFFAISTFAAGQSASPVEPSPCPLELSHLKASSLGINVQNRSGKRIVGLVFYAAISDAAEHWKWLHWNYDDSRPIQEFGWNKQVKVGEAKRLTWNYDLEREHGGGVALVLTSVLFADGTTWEEDVNGASCKEVWHHSHKKDFARPVELPPRN